MAGFITYWPKEQIRKLKKAAIYPVIISGGTLCVAARRSYSIRCSWYKGQREFSSITCKKRRKDI